MKYLKGQWLSSPRPTEQHDAVADWNILQCNGRIILLQLAIQGIGHDRHGRDLKHQQRTDQEGRRAFSPSNKQV